MNYLEKQKMIIISIRWLKKSLNKKMKLVQSMQDLPGFQTLALLFIWDSVGYKLWL